eukprot:gene29248-35307_t
MLSVPGREERVSYDSLSRTEQWMKSIKALTELSYDHPHKSVISMLSGRGHEIPRSEAKFYRYLKRVTKVTEARVQKAVWDELCSIDRKLNGVDLDTLPEALVSASDLVERYCNKKVLHVHRLDQETSGILVFAKADTYAGALCEQFREKHTEKSYLARVCGELEGSGVVNAPICPDVEVKPRQKVCYAEGKESTTRYEVILPGNPLFDYGSSLFGEFSEASSLVKLTPITGRTHQLRVHMRHIGHCIVGDALYGAPISHSRLCLHAMELKIKHPETKEDMVLSTLDLKA